jgi:DNA-binding CsgD family transcriptional regulator/tetratricopeptide (TPR) repeat protein
MPTNPVALRPLLGRDDECGFLADLIATVENGSGRSVVLYGDAGMGKTRLLEHAVALAPDLHTVWITGVEAERELGFAGLHRLLRPLLERRFELPRPQRDALGAAFGLDSSAAAPDRFMVGLACLTLLTDAASERGLVVVIDDAQWIDEESLAALAFVGRRLSADRLALLFGFRDDHAPQGALGGLPAMPVGGLHDDAALELLSTQVGAKVDAELARRIVDETRGCPLALLELAAELTDDQLRGGRPVSEPLPIGRRLEDHFLRQVRSLDEACQVFLLVAAAETSGDASLVRRVAATLGYDGSAEDAAVTSGLVAIDRGIAFRHPLIRSAIYGGAPAELRRRVHTAIAAQIDRGIDPDRHVQHLAAAARGADERLADELEAAARRAGRRGGHSTESGFLVQSAQLTSDPQRRSARLLGAATAAHEAGRLHRVEALLDQARPLLTDPLVSAEAARLDALGAQRHELRDVPSMLLAAARAFVPLDRGRARATLLDALHAALITQHFTTGTSLTEIAHVALANPSEGRGPPPLTDLLLDAVAGLVGSGYPAAAPLLRQAAVALGSDPVRPSSSDSYVGVTITNELWDDVSQALWCQRVEDSARDRGALTALAAVLNALGRYESRAGQFSKAEGHYDEAVVIEAAIGGHPEVIELFKCDLYAWRGQEAETVRAASALMQVARAVGGANLEQIGQVALATLALSKGRYPDAIDAVRPIVDADAPGFACQVLSIGVEAGLRTGDESIAAECLRRLEERAPAAGTPWGLGQLAQARALCATDADEAEHRYREAISLLASASIAPDLAHAHLLYGEWLRRENRRKDARTELRTAHDQYLRMGAEGFARRARIELSATGEKVRGRSVKTPSRLTSQEAQVARLAATGDTNAEIAARLFISASTVDYHLRKVFRKLEISSRRQLANLELHGPWAAEDD